MMPYWKGTIYGYGVLKRDIWVCWFLSIMIQKREGGREGRKEIEREKERARERNLGYLGEGEPGDAGEEPCLKTSHGHAAPVASVYAHYKSSSFSFLGI